jgi:hypothetical protein
MLRNVAVLSLLLTASSALAQVRAGGEFQINTYTSGVEAWGAPAMAPNGDFVIAWHEPDSDYYGIKAQRYDARGGRIGAEFRVNATTADYQVVPVVGTDARGNFAVVWLNWSLDGTQWNVFGQRFDAGGQPRGGEFQLNTFVGGNQIQDFMAMNAAGNFVAVWSSRGSDGSGYGLSGRRYARSGAPVGGEFIANTYTPGNQIGGNVSMNAAGQFVVVWHSRQDGDAEGIFGQRYDATGDRLGGEFQVNTATTGSQNYPFVGLADDGGFVVAWSSSAGGADGVEVRGRRYNPAGAAIGGEFAVNTYTTGDQTVYAVVSDARGNFVVTWGDSAADGSDYGVVGRRFRADGTPRGSEFLINAYTTDRQSGGRVGSDAVGNFTVAWYSLGQDGSSYGAFAQRFGGLVPSALAVDTAGNNILEPGETVDVRASWRNVNGAAQTFSADFSDMGGPAGATYMITDDSGDYGTVADGATAACSDCFAVAVSNPANRPATHWDASVVESITPDAQGQQKIWSLHVGRSFTDVPSSGGFYRFVETLLHNSVTAGCTSDTYCPASSTTREQMAVFVLVAREGSGYQPVACGTPVFGDVPAASPFCRWIEELARRGVASGCGGGNYCPAQPVTREQMAVFVLRTLDPTLDPPACTTPMFGDVPASSAFCRWIEELARRGVVTGCGGGNYCPGSPVTREQMSVFLGVTFGLTLYGA